MSAVSSARAGFLQLFPHLAFQLGQLIGHPFGGLGLEVSSPFVELRLSSPTLSVDLLEGELLPLQLGVDLFLQLLAYALREGLVKGYLPAAMRAGDLGCGTLCHLLPPSIT